jgi:hypothetical protein
MVLGGRVAPFRTDRWPDASWMCRMRGMATRGWCYFLQLGRRDRQAGALRLLEDASWPPREAHQQTLAAPESGPFIPQQQTCGDCGSMSVWCR